MNQPLPVEAGAVQLLPGESREDAVLIAEVVAALNRADARSGLERAVALSSVVLDHFFGGSLSQFKERRGQHRSFRALARCGHLEVSYSRLWSSLRVTEQLEQLSHDTAWALTLNHHRVLLGVCDVREKRRLATRAVEGGWSSRQLREVVSQRPKRCACPQGRPPRPPWEKVVRGIDNLLDQHGHLPEGKVEWQKARPAIIRIDQQITALTELKQSLMGRVASCAP